MVNGNALVIGLTNASGCNEFGIFKKKVLMYHKYIILKWILCFFIHETT